VRGHRLSLSVAGIIVAIVGGTTVALFVWPAGDRVANPDAVVLFVGGRGERLTTALELIELHGTDALVIPNGTVPTWPEANRLCHQPQPFRVFCPIPRPDTTRGEARAIAQLAEQQRWDRLAMVSSDYHISRARLLLSRCFDGELAVERADSGLGLFDRSVRIGHEWIGFTRARLLDRSC